MPELYKDRYKKVIWDDICADKDDKAKEHNINIYKLLSFWHQLYCLNKAGLLNRDLAKDLLSYQFTSWKTCFVRLATDTKGCDKRQDEAFEAFTSTDLDWLLNDKVIVSDFAGNQKTLSI